jgi:hypothetical protein
MSGAMGPGQRRYARGETSRVEAVLADLQYQPATKIADQYLPVRSSDGEGLLPCHASRSLGTPSAGIERLLVVVHGALRDSDRYFEHADTAARGMRSAALIVAPQFLADVDLEVAAAIPDGTLCWGVEGWKGGERALGPAPISSFTAMDSLLQQLTAGERLSAASRSVSLSLIPRLTSISTRSGRWPWSAVPAITAGAMGSKPHLLATRAGLAARHKLIQLDGVGHAASDVLAAQPTRELMFG